MRPNAEKLLAGCIAVPVHSANPAVGPTAEELESAATSAESRGLRVRLLLITNPNNPLGTIYRPDSVKSMIEWARTRKMHTIVDEIYSLSTHEVSVFPIKTMNADVLPVHLSTHNIHE